MQFEQTKENLPQFKSRVRDIEMRRGMSASLLKYVYPSLSLAALFLLASLIVKLNCWWTLLGLIFLGIGGLSTYMWYQFKKAEEFEEKLRSDRIREMNGSGKCMYLDGYVPDGSGKIGKCVLYRFTLSDYPYCIYCHEYQPRAKGEGGKRK
jgi:hypothetical protein